MQPIRTKRALLAAALVTLLALPAAAAAPAPAEAPFTINLRDYWILAEIVNPTTGDRAAFRVDCSDQSPLLCEGGPTPWPYLLMKLRVECGLKPPRGADLKHLKGWPKFVRAEIRTSFPPGIVGYVASGARGWAIKDQGHNFLAHLPPRAAPFAELRSEKGFSGRLSTVRSCEYFHKTDIRLIMWLVTPAELAARDAAAKAGKSAAGKARPALGRAPRR